MLYRVELGNKSDMERVKGVVVGLEDRLNGIVKNFN
jgi:hypothetical protein